MVAMPAARSEARSASTAAEDRSRPDVAGEEPERAPVDRDPLEVVHLEAVAPEERLEGAERVVEDVLVVDRVELELLDQVSEVRALQDGDAVVGEQP
jgi:hypothetical protein